MCILWLTEDEEEEEKLSKLRGQMKPNRGILTKITPFPKKLIVIVFFPTINIRSVIRRRITISVSV